MSIDRKKQLRTEFVNWLYDATDGNETDIVNEAQFLAETGTVEGELENVIRYLEGEGLVRPFWSGGGPLPGGVQITQAGAVEVEQAKSEPNRPTQHFAPMVNVTTIRGNVSGSQFQQGSPGATQSSTFTVDQRQQVADFSRAVRDALPTLGLDPATAGRTAQDLDVLDRELASPEPRESILQAMGTSVRKVVEGVATGAATAAILGLPWPF
ncbi:MAG: hypothetical protein ACR2JO_09525 [Mycobacteriales bacterium]